MTALDTITARSTGHPTLVLLHAGICDQRSWEPLADVLGVDALRIVTYDRRGFGRAPWVKGGSHLDDLLGVLDRVSPDEPVWLVGSSMGGGLAVDAALEHPQRVDGLVLFAPSVTGAPVPWDGEMGPATAAIVARMEAAEDDAHISPAAVAELDIEFWGDGPGHAGRLTGNVRELALAMATIAAASGAPDGAGESGVHAWSRLEELQVPTTVVWGSLDIPEARPVAEQLAERIAGAQFVELADVAHLPYLERPDECAQLVREALSLR